MATFTRCDRCNAERVVYRLDVYQCLSEEICGPCLESLRLWFKQAIKENNG